MLWIYTVLLASGIPHAIAQDDPSPPQLEPPRNAERPKQTEAVKHVHPYEFPGDIVTSLIDWNSGFLNKKPVYATLYASMKHDIHFYIFPPNHCQSKGVEENRWFRALRYPCVGFEPVTDCCLQIAHGDSVWFCLGKDYNITANGLIRFSLESVCEESLRFFPLEQIVYHTDGTSIKIYPYYSTLVEIIYQYTSEAQQQFIFKPDGEFDVEDIANVKKGSDIRLSLAGRQIIFLTSSPYCHATIQQPFGGIAKGYEMLFEAEDVNNYYAAPYWQGGRGEQDTTRKDIWMGTPSISFDPVKKRSGLKKSTVDCCPPTWEFEGFVTESEWNTYSKITYQRYKLAKRDKCEEKEEGRIYRYQSILVEVGKRCEWLRLCFDKGNKFCENDANTLSFIFAHDVYIPTDSDNARPFGVHRDQIDAIRLNFLIGFKGIEMAYAFSNTLNPGITELMLLQNYDGKNPQNLVINVVKSSNCEARLTTDLASINLRDGDETKLQCLWLSSCDCYE